MNKSYKRTNREGQIELSANFIIVIVLSIIIVVGGLALFFRMKGQAQTLVDTLDSQTQDRLKSMMLNDNSHIAVYPSDPVIGPGDSQLVGVGVTNNFDTETTFVIDVISVQRLVKGASDVTPAPGIISRYRDIVSTSLKIAPHAQDVKAILLKMPESIKGEYIYTIEVNSTSSTPPLATRYGILQVYATN